MKHIEVVGAAILRDKCLFATQRGYGPQKGEWEFPGGKIEEGEEPEVALKREIREELNSEIEVVRLLGISEHTYPQFHVRLQLFECRLISGKLELLEHENASWLNVDSLESVSWLPADLPLLPLVQEAMAQMN